MSGFGRKKIDRISLEKRRSERAKTSISGIVETPASREAVTVVDISAGGACLLGPTPAPLGRDVQLRVSELTLFGEIAWTKSDGFGLKFEDILNDQSSDALLQAAQEARAEKLRLERELDLQEIANSSRIDAGTEAPAGRSK